MGKYKRNYSAIARRAQASADDGRFQAPKGAIETGAQIPRCIAYEPLSPSSRAWGLYCGPSPGSRQGLLPFAPFGGLLHAVHRLPSAVHHLVAWYATCCFRIWSVPSKTSPIRDYHEEV